jgi:hypothetical protein
VTENDTNWRTCSPQTFLVIEVRAGFAEEERLEKERQAAERERLGTRRCAGRSTDMRRTTGQLYSRSIWSVDTRLRVND